MKDFAPQIALITICTVAECLLCAGDGFGICGLLAATCLVCACHVSDDQRSRILFICVFCLCVIPFAEIACFLPVATYLAMREGTWAARLLWIVPLLMLWVGVTYPMHLIGITAADTLEPLGVVVLSAICLASGLLAFADLQRSACLYELQLAFDSQRECCFALEEAVRSNEVAIRSYEDALSSKEGVAQPDDGAETDPVRKSTSTSFSSLTPRELSIVRLIADGKDNREIAGRLFLSEGTVRNHVSSILSKCGLSNRTQVAALYWQEHA